MYTKKQIFNNSCGAACLLSAAYDALSAQRVKNKLGCDAGDSPNLVEEVLYFVTSGAERAASLWDPNTAPYSLPSNICRAAKKVGFNTVKVHVDAGSGAARLLLGAYPNEMSQTRAFGGTVVNAAYDWENAGERCMVVILWNGGALHWVYAHKGLVMDPGTGGLTSASSFANSLNGRGSVAGIFLTIQ